MEKKTVYESEYFTKVIKLNRSFVAWINEFMKKSPDYDFSPVCNDYLKFISKLQKEYSPLTKNLNSINDSNQKKKQEVVSKKPLFQTNFDVDSSKLTSSTGNVSSVFKSDYFAIPNVASSSTASTATFLPQDVKDDGKSKNQDDEDSEDSTPLESSPVLVEEDALYTVKCKLYYKKEKKFTERGLGHLYIKNNDGKSQLIIRAENANATILLNIHLQKSLPIVCSENGVLLTCIPNPPLSSAAEQEEKKTVTFFIKVKDKLSANKLHEKLEKYKSD